MRKLMLFAVAATMAIVLALTFFSAQSSTAIGRTTLQAAPNAVGAIPHLPLHTLRPVY
jgi:hypothetical protein